MATYTFYSESSDGYVFAIDDTYAGIITAPPVVFAEADTGIVVGQSINETPDFVVYQGLLAFDSSSIGDSETVSTAELTLGVSFDGSDTDYTNEVFAYDFGAALDSADYRTAAQLSAFTRLASFSSVGFGSGFAVFTSDSAFAAEVSKTGLTKLIIASDRNRTGVENAGGEWMLFAGEDAAGTTDDPVLDVETTLSVTVSATGVSGTGAVGTATFSLGASGLPAGVSGAGAVGTAAVSGSASISLAGVAGAGAVGTATVSVSGAVTVSVAGVAGTGSVGALAVSGAATVGLAGVAGTGNIGALSVAGSALVGLTGVQGAGAVGTATVNAGITLTASLYVEGRRVARLIQG